MTRGAAVNPAAAIVTASELHLPVLDLGADLLTGRLMTILKPETSYIS